MVYCAQLPQNVWTSSMPLMPRPHVWYVGAQGEEGEDVADGTQRMREGEEQREGEEGEDCADVVQRRGGKGSC